MYKSVSVLLGKVLTSIERNKGEEDEDRYYRGGDTLVFTTTDGEVFKMYHEQDCCEHVAIEDINGDLDDLIGSPLTLASESSNRGGNPEEFESCTWTFYHFATVKGYVTIRWLGTSNGYYSEGVSFYEIKEEK